MENKWSIKINHIFFSTLFNNRALTIRLGFLLLTTAIISTPSWGASLSNCSTVLSRHELFLQHMERLSLLDEGELYVELLEKWRSDEDLSLEELGAYVTGVTQTPFFSRFFERVSSVYPQEFSKNQSRILEPKSPRRFSADHLKKNVWKWFFSREDREINSSPQKRFVFFGKVFEVRSRIIAKDKEFVEDFIRLMDSILQYQKRKVGSLLPHFRKVNGKHWIGPNEFISLKSEILYDEYNEFAQAVVSLAQKAEVPWSDLSLPNQTQIRREAFVAYPLLGVLAYMGHWEWSLLSVAFLGFEPNLSLSRSMLSEVQNPEFLLKHRPFDQNGPKWQLTSKKSERRLRIKERLLESWIVRAFWMGMAGVSISYAVYHFDSFDKVAKYARLGLNNAGVIYRGALRRKEQLNLPGYKDPEVIKYAQFMTEKELKELRKLSDAELENAEQRISVLQNLINDYEEMLINLKEESP